MGADSKLRVLSADQLHQRGQPVHGNGKCPILRINSQRRIRADCHHLAVFLLTQNRQGSACHQKWFTQVGIHHQVPCFEAMVVDHPAAPKWGNENHNIHPAKCGPGLVHHGFGCLQRIKLRDHRNYLAPSFLNFCFRHFEQVTLPAAQGNTHPVFCKSESDCPCQFRASAGDDGGFILK